MPRRKHITITPQQARQLNEIGGQHGRGMFPGAYIRGGQGCSSDDVVRDRCCVDPQHVVVGLLARRPAFQLSDRVCVPFLGGTNAEQAHGLGALRPLECKVVHVVGVPARHAVPRGADFHVKAKAAVAVFVRIQYTIEVHAAVTRVDLLRHLLDFFLQPVG